MAAHENKTAFPLSWPAGWPRTARHQVRESRFKGRWNASTGRSQHSMARVRQELADELQRLGAQNPVLSTNVKLRIDGLPFSNQAQPDNRGAAVYFTLKGQPVSLACDRWNRVEDNIWAMTKKIYNIREDERNGVGTVAQAFRGYMQLAAASTSSWWTVLGVAMNASAEQVKEAYRLLVKKHHPDAGGEAEMFLRVQTAFDDFQRIASGGAVNP